MRRKEEVEITNMCLIRDQQGRILMQNRVSKSWPGYALPGGHVEYGEPMTDAVIREIREETGLTIEHPRLCGIKDWMQEDGSRYMVLLYTADQYTGDMISSEEGENCWMTMDEISKVKMSSGMRSTMRVFLENDLAEQWFVRENDYEEIMK